MFHSETLDDDQSVYKRIVDRLEDLQRIHQELVIQTAKSGIYKDPKTFESKQKDTFEDIQNKTSESIKSLVDVFENVCTDYRETMMKSTSNVFIRIRDINVQTECGDTCQLQRANSRLITHYVRNAIDECITAENNINTIVKNHHERVRCTANRTATIKWNPYCENYRKNLEQQLEYQKQYYTDIIKEFKIRILSVEEENQTTFTLFSHIMSNAMNIQIKCDSLQEVYGTCCEMHIKASDYKEICQRTGENLDFKIEHIETDVSLANEKCGLLMSEWDAYRVQSGEISESVSKSINEHIEINKSLDELILQKTNRLQDLNNDFYTVSQTKQKIQDNVNSNETILEKLKFTLASMEKIKHTYKTQTHEQETNEKELLTSMKLLDEKIIELKNNKVGNIHELDYEKYISNYVNEFDLLSSEKIKRNVLLFEEKKKKISELDIEKNKLRILGDMRINMLKREKEEEEERQTNIINSEVKDKRQLLDLSKKEVENIKVKIPHYENLSIEVLCINNGIQDCTKKLSDLFRNIMIDNHGKTMDRLIQEEEELLSANIRYVDELQGSERNTAMEALLEERIQLLQERMKAITAQREQIEQANRGLEEELNKLSKNFVKIANNVQVPDETEEEKTN